MQAESAGEIRPVTPQEFKRVAKQHALALSVLYQAINSVAKTTGHMVAVYSRADDAPFSGGELPAKAEAAIKDISDAYGVIRNLFESPLRRVIGLGNYRELTSRNTPCFDPYLCPGPVTERENRGPNRHSP